MKMRKKISISIAVVIAVGFLKQLLPFRNPVEGASVNDYPIPQLNRASGRLRCIFEGGFCIYFVVWEIFCNFAPAVP